MPPSRRKKWTEAEERTLIDKYGEMVCDGSLSKMKTREKKYKPIALHVNSIHHHGDPMVYPWEWSWKDVSNKVQNMRHQYSLVKQKIKNPGSGDPAASGGDGFDWVEGLTHWSNFLRYKEVFGDVTLPFGELGGIGNNVGDGFDENNQGIEMVEFGDVGQSGDGGYVGGIDGGQNGVMGLEFDYDNDGGNDNDNDDDGNHVKEDGDNNGFVYGEIETMGSETRKKRKVVKKGWGFVANQLAQLREMEARFEQREEERERERQRRESLRVKKEEEREKQWEERRKQREEREKAIERLREQRNQEWKAMENEMVDRRRRRDEELIQERKWEERGNRRRSEWKVRIDEMLSQHRAELTQIQERILHEQQNLTSQLLGIVSQWTGHPTDNTTASSHYLSQMMQSLQHVGGMVDGDTQVEGHNQDDQFIVDG